MSEPDLNLLLTLDAVLAEGSVTRAARRLRLSPSAMSRSLARLREATGDPLLVRAGRTLVPTPRALELRERVSHLVQEARSMLRPCDNLNLAQLSRTFVLRTRDGFVENYGAALITRAAQQAQGVRLCFVPKPARDSGALRDGGVDLETGVINAATGPEIRSRALFRDRFVGAVHAGHPLAQGTPDAARYAQGRHISVSRRGLVDGPIDAALLQLGLQRDVATVVDGFAAALALARGSDLIASVPERQTGLLRAGMHSFPLALGMPEFTVSMLWHPRMEADPAHRWLRSLVFEVCTAAL